MLTRTSGSMPPYNRERLGVSRPNAPRSHCSVVAAASSQTMNWSSCKHAILDEKLAAVAARR